MIFNIRVRVCSKSLALVLRAHLLLEIVVSIQSLSIIHRRLHVNLHFYRSKEYNCHDAWCYVSNTDCANAEFFPSEYFQGRYYSYHTCLETRRDVARSNSLEVVESAFWRAVTVDVLRGRTLRFTYPKESKPWHYRHPSTGQWTGLMHRFFEELAQRGGFLLQYVPRNDYSLSLMDIDKVNTNTNGMMGITWSSSATLATSGTRTGMQSSANENYTGTHSHDHEHDSSSAIYTSAAGLVDNAWDACTHSVMMNYVDVCPTAAWETPNRRQMSLFSAAVLTSNFRLLVRQNVDDGLSLDPR
ncbi:unnamed protein product, partial [Amoebophrya sp. A25]|eukprot:GSA25T00004835001.1